MLYLWYKVSFDQFELWMLPKDHLLHANNINIIKFYYETADQINVTLSKDKKTFKKTDVL